VETGSERASVDSIGRFRGCLLGGAVGDALGAPVEFMSLAEIRARFGPRGVTGMVEGAWPSGSVTDDSQMALFTAEGLLRADVRWALKGICHPPSVVDHAYGRWLATQGERSLRWDSARFDGWLFEVEALHARRAPGNTCLSALRADRMGTIDEPLNHSKGCGGVMRIAPVGLAAAETHAFSLGAEIAALTHGHPSGYLTAGFLAAAIQRIRDGHTLDQALDAATAELQNQTGHEETLAAVTAARRLASEGSPTPERVEILGEGWVAEEALAIAVYAATSTGSFREAVLVAVNHGGDSDSTGAIAGNIAGALYGAQTIPSDWLEQLELREVITDIADDLYGVSQGAWDPERECSRYPGW
jgi:ADP-ribosyl-[dinitrogen reductase] hydrolase